MWSMTLLDKLRQPRKIKEMGTYMILEKGQWSIFTWRGGWGTFVTKVFGKIIWKKDGQNTFQTVQSNMIFWSMKKDHTNELFDNKGGQL